MKTEHSPAEQVVTASGGALKEDSNASVSATPSEWSRPVLTRFGLDQTLTPVYTTI